MASSIRLFFLLSSSGCLYVDSLLLLAFFFFVFCLFGCASTSRNLKPLICRLAHTQKSSPPCVWVIGKNGFLPSRLQRRISLGKWLILGQSGLFLFYFFQRGKKNALEKLLQLLRLAFFCFFWYTQVQWRSAFFSCVFVCVCVCVSVCLRVTNGCWPASSQTSFSNP